MKNTSYRFIMILKKRLGTYSLGVLGITVVNTCRLILLAILLKDIVDVATMGELQKLPLVIFKYLTILVVLCIWQLLSAILVEQSVVKAIGDLRKNLFKKINKLPISYFDHEHTGNVISLLTNDVRQVELSILNHLSVLLYFTICAICVVGFMFLYDFWLAIVGIVTAGIAFLFNAIFIKPLRDVGRKVQYNLGGMTEVLSDLLSGMMVVKSFNLYQKMIASFSRKNELVYSSSMKRVKTNAKLETLNYLGKMVDIIGILGIGAYFVVTGQASVGEVIAIWQLKAPLLQIFNRLGGLLTNLQTGLASAERIFEFLDEVDEPKVYQHLTDHYECESESAIMIQNVDFGYSADEKIIDNLSFEIKKGKKVTLVGPSGGGKTTIFKLLLGFYPPNLGEIKVEGESLAQMELSQLREKLSYVPQNGYLFNGSIIENIRHGKITATKEEVIRAAKIANAHDFIETFEDGYHTLVGDWGAQLSGGQRQRIIIAGYFKKDADILLLDEATSALDTEAEHLVQEAIDNLSHGKTTLIIAHRLSTIKNADEILVIDEGKIKERGKHEELLSIPNGVYRKLYQQQFCDLKYGNIG